MKLVMSAKKDLMRDDHHGGSPVIKVENIASSHTDTHSNSDVDAQTNALLTWDMDELPQPAKAELVNYVTLIASMYNQVLYHNFEHASHVLSSASALVDMLITNTGTRVGDRRGSDFSSVSKISDVTPEQLLFDTDEAPPAAGAGKSHLSTFGLSSCPMTHLALVMSALVHDVEHQGVGNKQLVDEKDPLAVKYDGNSVAENNSLDVALELLDGAQYSNLRECMFGPQADSCLNLDAQEKMVRDERLFHKVVHDVILATDINSQDRLKANKERWRKAFEDASAPSDEQTCCCCAKQQQRRQRRSLDTTNAGHWELPPVRAPARAIRKLSLQHQRSTSTSSDCSTEHCPKCLLALDEYHSHLNYLRATSVLEQLIQAADVAHLMQSWPVFLKWNKKLYDELWAAMLAGRGPNVSANWFNGQIQFFDFYVIPLAQRISQCGVFGSLGTLFLENARENRDRWRLEGELQCRIMHECILKRLGDKC